MLRRAMPSHEQTTGLRELELPVDPASASTDRSPESHHRRGAAQMMLEVTGILVIFFLLGGGPAPEVNEAHYLAKARHFWDSSFCSRDAFLNSGDGHFGFFLAFGWIAKMLPFSAAAWVGRIMAWTLLAWSWQRLSFSLVPRAGVSLLSAGCWAALIPHSQMSGEWVLGGWEAKVFAYGFVIAGLADVVNSRWARAGIWLGAASAMHILVGGWVWILVAFVWAIDRSPDRPSWRALLPSWLVGLALAMLALLPALRLQAGVDAATVQAANQIYVWGRLSHHLLLRAFPNELVLRHVLLIAIFMTLWCQRLRTPIASRLGRIVFGAIGLAIIGAVIDYAWGGLPGSTRWLRFYWFRLSDVFVPLGVSLLGMVALAARSQKYPHAVAWGSVLIAFALLGQTVQCVRAELGQPIPRADLQGAIHSEQQWQEWREACDWIRENTHQDAVVLSPFDHQTFKWYAHRAEVVTNKDVPQDARGLVDWWNRLNQVRTWQQCLTTEDYQQRASELITRYRADYVLVRRSPTGPSISHPIAYQNASYLVHRVNIETEKPSSER